MADQKVYKFTIIGRPLSQKNNIKIHKIGKVYRIGHPKKFVKRRDEICDEIFQQFQDQGGEKPIDYLMEIHYKFYHRLQWEPDLDNLPAVLLDAMQGRTKKVKGEKVKFNITILDDKLVRFQKEEKIIKGDPKWDDEERVEFTIIPYNLEKNYFQEAL